MPTLLAHEDETGLQWLDQSNVIAISGFDIRPGASGVCIGRLSVPPLLVHFYNYPVSSISELH